MLDTLCFDSFYSQTVIASNHTNKKEIKQKILTWLVIKNPLLKTHFFNEFLADNGHTTKGF